MEARGQETAHSARLDQKTQATTLTHSHVCEAQHYNRGPWTLEFDG
jgi:hypothetical protein